MIRSNWPGFWCGLALVGILLEPFTAVLSAPKYEAQCDPKNPKNCSQPLLQGEVAPFSGQLLPTDFAINLGQKAYWCEERLQLKLKLETQKLEIDLQAAKNILELQTKSHQQEIDLLTERLKEAHDRPWIEKPVVVSALTVVAVLLIIFGTTQIAKAAN